MIFLPAKSPVAPNKTNVNGSCGVIVLYTTLEQFTFQLETVRYIRKLLLLKEFMNIVILPQPQLQSVFITKLADMLATKKPLLILLSGGSLIPLYTELFETIKTYDLSHLTVGLIDERYGKPGHANSNWEQINATGLFTIISKKKGHLLPVLETGLSLTKTAQEYQEKLKKVIASKSVTVIGILGIGADGHTAGLLPLEEKRFKELFSTKEWVIGYSLPVDHENPYKHRITVTPYFIQQCVDSVFVYAVGDSKKEAIQTIGTEGAVLQKPARLLEYVSGTLFTDQKIR